MENTPKLQRKSSLSLSTRLNKKRHSHSASPQNIVKTAASNGVFNNLEVRVEVPRSPSIISISSDGGIDCTPPHKKIGMCVDDDYSPKIFDSSFSPSCLLSQTLAIDSPEVGWKWSRYSSGSKNESSARTPDSAYAADSSFTSAGSSSTEMRNVRTRNDTYQQRMAYDARREQELRRVEKTRADQKLKQRCAKLQEQLKCAGTQKTSTSQSNGLEKSGNPTSASTISTDAEMTSQTTTSTVKLASPIQTFGGNVGETFNDFFNDSDEDCFLLAATQEIESKINAKPEITKDSASSSKTFEAENDIKSKISSVSTVKSCSPAVKEKRSSFYMKFLEDDCPDDWFVSLDEVIEQATQPKKPRTSFQRYKSLPVNSKDVDNDGTSASKSTAISDPILNGNASDDSFVESMGMTSSMRSKIKRHSSTHTLSPAGANRRGQQHH